MFSAPMWFALTSSLIVATCEGHGGRRYRRSDDPNPLEATVLQQGQAIAQLQAEVASMKSNFESRIAKQETAVAFNTRLSGPKNFTGSEILILDLVDMNRGNGYDRLTGMFTAPVSGYYVISAKFAHTPPGRLHVHVYKNQTPLAESEASGDDTKYLDRASTTVILHLAVGDKVYVKRDTDSTSTQIWGYYTTSFEGILVVADHP